jgi:HPt (histidine-containing phosphotransfer) domain-containing protein
VSEATEIASLIPAYLERRAGDVVLLLDSGDFESIKNLGHKLSGNGSMYGFDQISLTGRELESASVNRDMAEIRKYTQKFSEYLAHLQVRLAKSSRRTK